MSTTMSKCEFFRNVLKMGDFLIFEKVICTHAFSPLLLPMYPLVHAYWRMDVGVGVSKACFLHYWCEDKV